MRGQGSQGFSLPICSYVIFGTGLFPTRVAYFELVSGLVWNEISSGTFLPMADSWSEKLRCPRCHKTGMASLSQADIDDWPTVVTLPDGFKLLKNGRGPVFHCATCDVEVDP